ncbi:membrane protein [Plantactinospora endophytica]|uniref:Membrane protein n=1 Tax=Plantactinospora endophytica TaxID=673535 RepID=A0ABQ4DY82_9ACTN|nr:membrane protein [Plantactinospora endophytica]
MSNAAIAVSVVFLALGVLGFIPEITSNYDDMRLAGHLSDARLFGLFEVSVLHNLVHLVTGVIGLALARTATGARTFLVGGGAVYLVLFVYGITIEKESLANFLPVDDADNWLHLVLGIAMIGLGALTGRRRGR